MAAPVDETSLIQRYLAPLAAREALGLKDDAALLTPRPGNQLVLTADMIVEGTHFLPDDDPADIAAKAIAVNLSDLTAKGASPVGYLVTIALPAAPSETWMQAFAAGLSARAHGRILGGDMTVGGERLGISVTAIGQVPEHRFVPRSGARIGDLLFVTGPLGTSAAGLEIARDPDGRAAHALSGDERTMLTREYRAPAIPFADIYARIVRDHATAALDISDGLLIDAERLCAASGTGARIEADRVPVHPAVRKLIDAGLFSLEAAATGGDDYVVLFAVPPEKAEQVETAGGIAKCHRIGEVVAASQGVTVAGRDGLPLSFPGTHGYDHFLDRGRKD